MAVNQAILDQTVRHFMGCGLAWLRVDLENFARDPTAQFLLTWMKMEVIPAIRREYRYRVTAVSAWRETDIK